MSRAIAAPLPRLLTVAQAADHLDSTTSKLYELVARHALPSVRIGRVIRIPRDAVSPLASRPARAETEACPSTLAEPSGSRATPSCSLDSTTLPIASATVPRIDAWPPTPDPGLPAAAANSRRANPVSRSPVRPQVLTHRLAPPCDPSTRRRGEHEGGTVMSQREQQQTARVRSTTPAGLPHPSDPGQPLRRRRTRPPRPQRPPPRPAGRPRGFIDQRAARDGGPRATPSRTDRGGDEAGTARTPEAATRRPRSPDRTPLPPPTTSVRFLVGVASGRQRSERSGVAVYDERRVQDTVLALMHLNAHKDTFGWRAWKSFPWDATDGLHERGLISDPRSKAKSVVLTDEGARLAEQLFTELFGVEDAGAE
jgi:excisionase family DNA binding protein